MKELYLAIDGDDVGHRLEYFMLTENRESLEEFSTMFESAMSWLKDTLIRDFGAVIVFSGGDNLLASIGSNTRTGDELEKLRTAFAERARTTLSMGLGESLHEAYFALKLAKTSGKNRIHRFREFSNG
jgi:GTP cyclohydrolase III